MKTFLASLLSFAALFSGITAVPASAATIIGIDVNGNGSIDFGSGPLSIPGSLQQDPGPGGAPSILTYALNAPNLTAGDVFVNLGNHLEDVIRFNPAGSGGDPNYLASALFYASTPTGILSLADTPQLPLAFYANTVNVTASISNGIIADLYTPLPGQPGYVPNFNVSYSIAADPVPEPSTIFFMLSGMIAVGVLGRKQLFRTSNSSRA